VQAITRVAKKQIHTPISLARALYCFLCWQNVQHSLLLGFLLRAMPFFRVLTLSKHFDFQGADCSYLFAGLRHTFPFLIYY
jgi:hypothetical protein